MGVNPVLFIIGSGINPDIIGLEFWAKMRTSLVSRLWVIFALALVACGRPSLPPPVAEPTPTPTPEPVAVRVILREFSIESSLATFAVGTTYRFSITNRGDLAHQFVLEPLDALDEPLTAEGREAKVGTDRLLSRTTVTLQWTFTAAGNFQIACHVPGHYGQGMVLPVSVE